MAPADKAANNIVVVLKKRYYINTLKLELRTAKTHGPNRLDEAPVVERHQFHMATRFGVLIRTITSFLSFTGYQNFINDPVRHVLLLILVDVQLPSCLYY